MSDERSVVVERMLPHAQEKVWRALTETDLLSRWLMRNDFEPVVGRAFQFRAEPVAQWNGIIDCELLAMEPIERLKLQWNSAGLESVVEFTLAATSEGTALRMVQTGFPANMEHAFKGATYGWQRHMANLEQFLAGGAK